MSFLIMQPQQTNNMRKVHFQIDSDKGRMTYNGFFHQFSITGFDGDINSVAIIEDEQGVVREIPLRDFKFLPLEPTNKKDFING